MGYMAPPGGLEEDDLDHRGGSQNLLCECRFTSDFPDYKYSVAVLKYIFRYQYFSRREPRYHFLFLTTFHFYELHLCTNICTLLICCS